MGIVIHAARATHDWLPVGVRRGDRIYHVLSDIIGPEGQRELREFVAAFGIRARWTQYPNTYREHFDAPGRSYDVLMRLGARLISTRELGLLLKAKRAAMQPESD